MFWFHSAAPFYNNFSVQLVKIDCFRDITNKELFFIEIKVWLALSILIQQNWICMQNMWTVEYRLKLSILTMCALVFIFMLTNSMIIADNNHLGRKNNSRNRQHIIQSNDESWEYWHLFYASSSSRKYYRFITIIKCWHFLLRWYFSG